MYLTGRVGGRAIAYYMGTTVCAVILGIILVTTIQPGSGANPEKGKEVNRNITTEDTLMDLVRNLFPPNIVQACTKQMTTSLVYNPEQDADLPKKEWAFKTMFQDNTNILGKFT